MSSYKDRLQVEIAELSEKISKLQDFIYSYKFDQLSEVNQILLSDQEEYMIKYLNILKIRLEM